MSIVIDEVVTEIDSTSQSATNTEQTDQAATQKTPYEHQLSAVLKRAEERKKRLSAE